jgi:hypothetical protein
MVSETTLSIPIEALVEPAQGQNTLKIWVFITKIIHKFIMELDILQAFNTTVDVRHNVLRLSQEEMSLWCPETRP